MKAKKEKKSDGDTAFTLEDLKGVIEEVLLPSQQNLQLDIDTKIENLAKMIARSFRDVDGKVSAIDQRLVLSREEILRKLDGTNNRIDDLALNRATKDEVYYLGLRVSKIENKMGFSKK